MEEVDDFDKTLTWALEEENVRTSRGQGIGTFYLVIASIVLFVIVFLVLYFYNRGSKVSALDMMRDPNNIYDDVSETENDEEEADFPKIDLSEERELKQQPPIDDLVEL